MVYLERSPSLPLAAFVRKLWYARAPDVPHAQERVLPNGCLQIVISLAADTLTGSAAHSILLGARCSYETIDTRDLAELMGIVLQPGGLGPWLKHRADAFFGQSVELGQVWNDSGLRDRLTQDRCPRGKLDKLDALLALSLKGREIARKPLVEAALPALSRQSVKQTAQWLGVSERRLHQVFREDVGLSPKLWSRIQRFQRAVRALHSGAPVRWDRLALDCGYYDQPHFSNDFHAFSGIDPTTYSARRGPWPNHVPL